MRALHWFRNDLRLYDNTALSAAAARADEMSAVFVLDPRLLAGAGASRTRFMLDCLRRLKSTLEERGSSLIVRHGNPATEIPRLIAETKAGLLTYNRDYSPYARRRDATVTAAARRLGIGVLECKDRVVFEADELLSSSAKPYVVYTPYRRSWLERLRHLDLDSRTPLHLPAAIPGVGNSDLPDAVAGAVEIPTGGEAAGRRRLRAFLDADAAAYAEQRDILAADATSHLSPYLRFGVVSVRECVATALEKKAGDRNASAGASKWLDQIIWRDFYSAILATHPRVLTSAFRAEYNGIEWNDDDDGFAAWCQGRTGYPIVDAGMRQLVQTGWMHNRARMIVASFLVKDLLLDWRRGEAFFMQHLVDGDPANNNGGWQWAASTGTDAQPYFRIFNPSSQGGRFDPRGEYVRRFVPELKDVADRYIHRPWEAPAPPPAYPPPIVDHSERRMVAIARFEAARSAVRKT